MGLFLIHRNKSEIKVPTPKEDKHMRKDIPLDEFTISVHEDGVYQRCPECGKEAKLETKEGRAKLVYCPECGAVMNPDK
jgi:predicted RNA-binding Zn-ribbon protein involved in translation (DUF1610 family)